MKQKKRQREQPLILEVAAVILFSSSLHLCNITSFVNSGDLIAEDSDYIEVREEEFYEESEGQSERQRLVETYRRLQNVPTTTAPSKSRQQPGRGQQNSTPRDDAPEPLYPRYGRKIPEG